MGIAGGPETFPQHTNCTAATRHRALSTSVWHGEGGHCTEGGRSESTKYRTVGEGLPLDPAFAVSYQGRVGLSSIASSWDALLGIYRVEPCVPSLGKIVRHAVCNVCLP